MESKVFAPYVLQNHNLVSILQVSDDLHNMLLGVLYVFSPCIGDEL